MKYRIIKREHFKEGTLYFTDFYIQKFKKFLFFEWWSNYKLYSSGSEEGGYYTVTWDSIDKAERTIKVLQEHSKTEYVIENEIAGPEANRKEEKTNIDGDKDITDYSDSTGGEVIVK